MPTFTFPYPPIATWQETFGPNGVFMSNVRLARSGTRTVTRPIAVKRKKPLNLLAQENQTSWSGSSSNSFGSACDPRSVRSGSNTTVYHDAMSDHYAIDFIERGDLPSLDLSARLGNKAVGELKDGAANIALMLGEYRQTAKLFADLTPRLAQVTKAAFTRNPKMFLTAMGFKPGVYKTVPKRVAEAMLQWRYGVEPLVGDLHDSVASLRGALARPLRMPVKVSITETMSKAWVTSSRLDVPDKVVCTAVGRRKDTLKGYYLIDNDLLLNGLGLYGLTNPMALAWELIPGSFILDWWFSVGDVLSSLDHSLYVKGSGGNRITRQSYVTTGRILGGASYATSSSYSRVPSTLPTRATLIYKESASRRHIENGLALLTVALSNILLRKR